MLHYMNKNTPSESQSPHHEPESPKAAIMNILFNIVIPVFILSKGSGDKYLGPVWGLIIALLFPLSYGAYDLYSKKKWNFVSILGLVSILLTGGLALLKLDRFWFAVKEGIIPGIIGVGVLATAKSKYNMVRMIILNPKIIELEKIEAIIEERNLKDKLESLVIKTTYLFFLSFQVSAVLNFVLAVVILKSEPGTEAFNLELGKMTALSFPVIMLPSMIILAFSLWFLLRGISRMTDIEFNDLIKGS